VDRQVSMAGGFDSLGLMPELIRAVDEIGWYLPTDVQDEAIPLILGGGDVMVASETGSGKTGAFSLPIAQVVYETMRKEAMEKCATHHSVATAADLRIDESDKDGLFNVAGNGLGGSVGASKNWAGARASHGLNGGKYFYEAVVEGDGICRFGWSTKAGHLELGRDGQGFGYGGTSKKSHNNEFLDYGCKFGSGDAISCMIDLEEFTISYSVNGVSQGIAFIIPERMRTSAFFPAFCLKSCAFEVNFGSSGSPPLRFHGASGFRPIGAAEGTHIVSAKSNVSRSTGKRTPRALILEPARDLAEQVYNNFVDITKYLANPSLKSMLLVGGDDNKKQRVSSYSLFELIM
jgi:ATP-dependent RNA helicase DDX1